jgi:RNA polymerase sigma-70 factor (ECF subfamily)
VAELNEHLDEILRRERGPVVGALLRFSGSLDAAEEAFQEALLSAIESWPKQGVPDKPAAWLTTAAKNHLRDARRHRGVAEAKAPLLLEPDESTMQDTIDTVADDQLRLVFTCCHPELPRESQVALTLKVILGFSVEEIARAFLSNDEAITQRIVRAKRTIEEKALSYVVPDRAALPERVASVLAVVYLIFNEGYTSREGALVRLDLQAEALRLGRLLGDLLPTNAEVFGLYALMAFAASRAATRTDAEGVLLLLSEQDRARWSRPLIREGLAALERARSLGGGASYVLQAEIAARHATAPTWDATDWRAIARCYDALLAVTHSPVVALNRAIAIGMRDGADAALRELVALEAPLSRYHLFYATRADFLRKSGRDARADYERALDLATNDSERAFLRRRIAELAS